MLNDAEPDWHALIRACFENPQNNATLMRFFQAILPYIRAALAAIYPRDLSVIEDALQNAFLKYLDIFRRAKKPRALSVGYFVVVAKNCLVDELRRRKGQIPIDDLAESELPNLPKADPSQREARMLLLQHGITRLDPRCQRILQTYYIEEVKAETLAAMLDIAPDSVHMAIKRCRDRLRSILLEEISQFSAPR